MHNIKQSDIVRHKRRGTHGIVAAVDSHIIRVVWHLGDGMRISYDHKATTKVVELVHKYSDYGRFYESGRTMLATYFGYKFDRNHNRSQALGAWLDSFASDKQRGLPMEDDETCDCLTRETVDIKNVLSGKTLKDFQREQGMAQGALSFRSRHTGKSTGIALGAISAAVLSPATPIKFLDHHREGQAQAHLFMVVCNLIDILGLKGFDVNKQQSTITFHPFVEVRTTYEPKTIVTPIR